MNVRTTTKVTKQFHLTRDDVESSVKDEYAPIDCVASFAWNQAGDAVVMTVEFEEEETDGD